MVVDPPTRPSYVAGDDATVKVVLVNVGSKNDLLQSITSPAVTDWGAFNTTAEADAVLEANASRAVTTDTSSAAPLPAPGQRVIVPAGSRVSWGTPEATGALVFLKFTKDVFPGTTIPVTLRFAQAGSITISVPIGLSNSINTSPIPTPSGVEG
jgi:copper(I)-binding protein